MNVDFSRTWQEILKDTIAYGADVSPRGKRTLEIQHRTSKVNMRKPVLMVPERRLGYKFMAAEAYWILSGDNRVSTIAPYSANIAKFSDDGIIFNGAYGPPIKHQIDYVVQSLIDDSHTRQSGLTIWRPNPKPSKDIPCTVSIFFTIRSGSLNCHVFMRSSDIWLGLPYDVFNFSMLSHLVAAKINSHYQGGIIVIPDTLHLTAASSHLYGHDVWKAQNCSNALTHRQNITPTYLYMDEQRLMRRLKNLRESEPSDNIRWWEL